MVFNPTLDSDLTVRSEDSTPGCEGEVQWKGAGGCDLDMGREAVVVTLQGQRVQGQRTGHKRNSQVAKVLYNVGLSSSFRELPSYGR